MSKKKKWILGVVLVILAAPLLINPRLINPPLEPGHDVTGTNTPPADVMALLHGACYDCHSDETKWPWYSHVAPVSWWLVEHVNDGRERLNFSQWPHDDAKRAARRWRAISDSVSDGYMPLVNYDKLHPAARLTQAQRDKIIQFADQEAERLRPTDD